LGNTAVEMARETSGGTVGVAAREKMGETAGETAGKTELPENLKENEEDKQQEKKGQDGVGVDVTVDQS